MLVFGDFGRLWEGSDSLVGFNLQKCASVAAVESALPLIVGGSRPAICDF